MRWGIKVKPPHAHGDLERRYGKNFDACFPVKGRDPFCSSVDGFWNDLDVGSVYEDIHGLHLGLRNIGQRPTDTITAFGSQDG